VIPVKQIQMQIPVMQIALISGKTY